MKRWFGLFLGVALCAASQNAAAVLKAGDTLDKSSWEQARDLLPPEMLEKYKAGEYSSPIGEVKPGVTYSLDQSFLSATEANEGKFKIDEHGSVVEVATGKIPDFNFGGPFGKLDPSDPQIALKVMWNYEYAYWSNGSTRLESQLLWLSRDSKVPERAVRLQTMAKIYEGSRFREENPMQFSRLDRNFLIEPTDIHGTASLGWRYKDPVKRDSQWAYVPALRRVRAVSPANRSDGVFGSEMTQDDGFNGFDAKPEDFTYKLVRSGEEYMAFSPESLNGELAIRANKTGQGWDVTSPEQLRYGFSERGFNGAPWIPLDNTLVKRPVWVIEATPKDRYYLYGNIIFGIDRETYKVSNVIKYDWKGKPVGIFVRGINFGKAPDGYRYVNFSGGGRGGAFAENSRMNRATVAEFPPGSRSEQDSKIDFNEFQPENLVRMGR